MGLTLRTTCTCGHDRSSHYAQRDGTRTTCLCRGCTCSRYRDELRKPPLEPDESAPDTDRDWLPPAT